MKKINLIQDIATPHNNVIINSFLGRQDVSIRLWYAEELNSKRYPWSKNITHEHFTAAIYGRCLNLKFVVNCLLKRDELFLIVGWMNINTILLHLLFYITRKQFNHWTDLPNDKHKNIFGRLKSYVAYFILLHSRSRIFCVGKSTLDYFIGRGFSPDRLINLPIFVDVIDDLAIYRSKNQEVSGKYNLSPDGILISAGSRLIYDKGFDLFIIAISKIQRKLRKKIKCIIVGSGEEELNLIGLIKRLDLESVVVIERWLDFDDFMRLVANSDIFVQPSRFDAYGSTIFGMSLGVAVIGSSGAGAAVDRINHGLNGLIYNWCDTDLLASHIEYLIINTEFRHKIASEGHLTAKGWHPSIGVDIIVGHAI